MERELLPCPFCGESGAYTTYPAYLEHHVQCGECFARTGFCDSVDEAVDEWNRRTPDIESFPKVWLLWCKGEHEHRLIGASVSKPEVPPDHYVERVRLVPVDKEEG